MSKLSEAIDWNRKRNEHGLQRVDAAKSKSYLSQGIDSMGPGKVSSFLEQKAKGRTEPVKRPYEAGETVGRGLAPTPWPTEKQKAFPTQKKQPEWMASDQPYATGLQRQSPQKSVGTAAPSGPLEPASADKMDYKLPVQPVSSYAAGYQGTPQSTGIPYAAGLQGKKPGQKATYDAKYQTSGVKTEDKTEQASFRHYVKLPSPEEQLNEYLALMAQPDFEEKSKYQNTYDKSREKFSAVTGIFTNTGFDDILYDYINGNEIAHDRISLAPGVRTYGPIPEKAVKLFNYIYQTKGSKEAYRFMDLISQKQYSGIEAWALGAAEETGLFSASAALGKGISALTGDAGMAQSNEEWTGMLEKDIRTARKQHPVAYGTGAVSGNVALTIALGKGIHVMTGKLAAGVKFGEKTVQVILPKVVEGTVNSSLAFLGKTAIQNAGAAATGKMSGEEYLKSLGKAGAQGMAGGLAGGLVNSGLETVLRESGMMTPFMEFVKQSTAGFAAASANMGTGYALSEEKPSEEQIAMDLTTAFLFSVIQGGISAYQTTNATKTYMETQYEHIVSDYTRMSQEWNELTPAERAEYAQLIRGYTQELRAGLRAEYLAGQQGFVNDMTRALDTLDKAMESYVSYFASGTSGTAGALVPTGTGTGDGLALQLQKSIAEGLSAATAQEGQGAAIRPLEDGGAYTGPGKSELADDATVDDLLRNRSMVDYLTRKGGLKLTRDMTQEQKRAAVREAIARVVNKSKDATSSGLLEEKSQTQADPAIETAKKEAALTGEVTGDIVGEADDGSFTIGVSLGAKAKNYDVLDVKTGIVYQFVEGTRVSNPTIFAGYKGVKPLYEDTVAGLVEEFGGEADKWQHVKGVGILDVDGEEIKAEIHWFQEESVGKVKFKIKEWIYN